MRGRAHLPLGALLATALAVAPSIASAQPAAPRRLFGFGVGLGLGIDRTSYGHTRGALFPLDLELRVPVTPRVEIALWFPVGSNVWGNISEDRRSFFWADVFATWYPLRDAGGLFVAPGLGIVYGSTSDSSGVGLEIPARLGWEFSNATRSFGAGLSARPWIDVVFPSDNLDVATRYGVIFELTLIGYVRRSE